MRQKKGPKRLKKKVPLTIDDLDKEMEDYRAAAPDHLGL
jgi:THO complex subunit 4